MRELRRDAGTTVGGGNMIQARISCMGKKCFSQGWGLFLATAWTDEHRPGVLTEGFPQHAAVMCQYDMCNLCGDVGLAGHEGPENFVQQF